MAPVNRLKGKEKEVIASYLGGVSCRQIAKQYQSAERSVRTVLLNNNVEKQRSKLYGKHDEVVSAYLKNPILKDVATSFNVADGSIRQVLEKYKVQLKGKSNVMGREVEIKQAYQQGDCISDLCLKYSISPLTVKMILKEGDIQRRYRGDENRSHAVNHEYFNEINTQEKAYFLGFLFADGWNIGGKSGSIGLTLHEKDVEIVNAFREAIGSTAPLHRAGNNKQALGIRVHSRRLSSRLTELGCMPTKTFKLTFPEWLNPALYNHFIRGYFDGDGSITDPVRFPTNSKIFALGTISFIGSIAEILQKECAVTTLTRPHPRSAGICQVTVSGNLQLKRVIEYLYRDAAIYLQRKKDRADIILNSEFRRARGRATRPRITKAIALEVKAQLLLGKGNKEIAQLLDISSAVVYTIRACRAWVNP